MMKTQIEGLNCKADALSTLLGVNMTQEEYYEKEANLNDINLKKSYYVYSMKHSPWHIF